MSHPKKIRLGGVTYVQADRETVAAWESLPKGWTEDSLQSMWSALTGDRKHKITACMKKMEGKVTDPGAFCASLARKLGEK